MVLLARLVKCWEFEKCLLDGTVVINVDGIFKHVVQEVGVRLYVVIEALKIFYLPSLLFVEQVEVYFKAVQLLILDLVGEVRFLFSDLAVSLLELLLLIVE